MPSAAADKPVDTSARQVPSELIENLKARGAEVESLLKSGSLGGIYVPALQAKELALEIQATQAEANRDAIEASVKQIVLAAYQLDNYGDLGDAGKAQEAFRSMSAAIATLDSLVPGRR